MKRDEREEIMEELADKPNVYIAIRAVDKGDAPDVQYMEPVFIRAKDEHDANKKMKNCFWIDAREMTIIGEMRDLRTFIRDSTNNDVMFVNEWL